MKLRYAVPVALVVLLPAWVSALGEDRTEYYAVLTDGKKIGHSVSSRKVVNGKIVTTEDVTMTIGRVGQQLTVRESTTSIETTEGQPIGYEYKMAQGLMAQELKGAIGADGKLTIHINGPAGKQTTTTTWPEGALLSEGLRLLARNKGLKPGTAYSARAFLPSLGMAVAVHAEVAGRKKVDLLGRVVDLAEIKTNMQLPLAAVSSLNYVDDDHRPLKTVTEVMGITIEIVACDKTYALSDDELVDFLKKLLLQSPSALTGIKQASSARYFLKAKSGKTLAGMVVTDSQTLSKGADGQLVVTIKPTQLPSCAPAFDKSKHPEPAEYLKPSKYLQSDHAEITALTAKAVGGQKDPSKAAKLIETFVGKYITAKNLSVGYASAVEVARSRQGDCSEHAVLAAAMCRAAGIPARVVAGYVYVPRIGDRKHVFGGHAWLEVYIAGKWVGLDPLRGGVGCGHIAQATGNGDPSDFFSALNTMGNFTIEKVELELQVAESKRS